MSKKVCFQLMVYNPTWFRPWWVREIQDSYILANVDEERANVFMTSLTKVISDCNRKVPFQDTKRQTLLFSGDSHCVVYVQ